MTCTFFGHRNCPEHIKPRLKAILEELILNENADTFLVGNNGNFDAFVYHILRELKIKYPFISYSVVLAYFPDKYCITDPSITILPDGIEYVPKKFAIAYRNKWMIDKADCVVSYVTRSYGGAAQFVERAKRKNKICINLTE